MEGSWGRGWQGQTSKLCSEMPRFSDIFVYASGAHMPNNRNMIVFTDCYLLKTLGDKPRNSQVDKIVFDIEGMFIMIHDDRDVIGPFCLTVTGN